MWTPYLLTVGLPHTNHRQLSEVRLLMEAAHVFWDCLARRVGCPVSDWRSAAGDPVYPMIYYVEERLPQTRPLSSFRLGDELRLLVEIKTFSALALQGSVAFDRASDLSASADPASWSPEAIPHPFIRFGSLFATPRTGYQGWKFATPANIQRARFEPLDPDQSPSQLTRQAQDTGKLGMLSAEWAALDATAPTTVTYAIDPDRDTSATGLVYFASYVALLELGERAALVQPTRAGHRYAASDLPGRTLCWRRVAYYGNAGSEDQLAITVSRFAATNEGRLIGLRSRITRVRDGELIALAETHLLMAPVPVVGALAGSRASAAPA